MVLTIYIFFRSYITLLFNSVLTSSISRTTSIKQDLSRTKCTSSFSRSKETSPKDEKWQMFAGDFQSFFLSWQNRDNRERDDAPSLSDRDNATMISRHPIFLAGQFIYLFFFIRKWGRRYSTRMERLQWHPLKNTCTRVSLDPMRFWKVFVNCILTGLKM